MKRAVGGRRTRVRKVGVLCAVLAIGLVWSGCSSNTARPSATPKTSSGGGTTVAATEKDFAIALAPTAGSGPSVTFNITNAGPTTHEFVVFKTDLDPAALPLSTDGTEVNEDGPGVTHIGEKEDIAKDATVALTLTLQPGTYVMVCNLPTHYKLGMHAPFTVSS